MIEAPFQYKKCDYSFSTLKLDRQKVAGTLMATGKTGFFGCTLLGSDGSNFINTCFTIQHGTPMSSGFQPFRSSLYDEMGAK